MKEDLSSDQKLQLIGGLLPQSESARYRVLASRTTPRTTERRRVAIIGGGTAGFLAAAHLTKKFPNFELFHIYDSRIPTIGVGEGTTPLFPVWLRDITALDDEEIRRRCRMTKKHGLFFENWGRQQEPFQEDFFFNSYAYHISAGDLVSLLSNYVRAEVLDHRVTEVTSNGREVTLEFENRDAMTFDFVFDARGFPRKLTKEHLPLREIPTNAALIRRGPAAAFNRMTRCVARPHGWVFIVPLSTHTSYGYVYNENISTREDVIADMNFLFHRAGIPFDETQERHLRFPNFTRRQLFDGALFHIGNAASFIEPLEATAIHITLFEIDVASKWLADGLIDARGEARRNAAFLNGLNKIMRDYVAEAALFVSWHYGAGSRFDTPFWKYAVQNFCECMEKPTDPAVAERFRQYLAAGRRFSPDILQLTRMPPFQYQKTMQQNGRQPYLFAGFSEVSFAQIGYGTGYFYTQSEMV